MTDETPNSEVPRVEGSPSHDDQQRGTADLQSLHSPIMRERGEPRDGHEPFPMWLLMLFGALTFWAGWYLGHYSGAWDSKNLEERPELAYAGAGGADKEPITPFALGEKVFKANCVSCHQMNGAGVAGQYPSLVGSRWVLENPQRLKRILLHGMEGPIEVLGKTYNSNMPDFGKRLSDEHIAGVLTYIGQAWGNTAGSVLPASVSATREATKDRKTPWRAEELLLIKTLDFTPPPPTTEGSANPSGDKADGK